MNNYSGGRSTESSQPIHFAPLGLGLEEYIAEKGGLP